MLQPTLWGLEKKKTHMTNQMVIIIIKSLAGQNSLANIMIQIQILYSPSFTTRKVSQKW